MEDIPRFQMEIPQWLEEFLRSFGEIPEALEEIPEALGEFLQRPGDILQPLGDILQSSGDIPEASGELLQRSGENQSSHFDTAFLMKMILQLKECTPLARGGKRIVFAHPDAPALLVKVIRPDARLENPKKPSWRKRLFWRFRRFKHYNAFKREVDELIAAYANSGNDRPPSFFQRFYGFLETDLGLGSVTRAELDQDGNYAPTLAELVWQGRFTAPVRNDLNRFIDQFLRHNVVACDFHEGNLVHAWDETHGSHFVIIDGLGDKNLVPLCTLFPRFNRHYKRRRICRMKKRLELLAKRREREAHAPAASEGGAHS